MDFNGDGIVNGEDAQALLDYVTGIRTELHDAEHADLNSDGEINAYDAYLFLQRFNSGVLTLPANGKVEVSVTIRLTSEQKEKLDANYPVGHGLQQVLLHCRCPQNFQHLRHLLHAD